MNRKYLLAGVLVVGGTLAISTVPGSANAAPSAAAAQASAPARGSAVARAPYLKLAAAKKIADVTLATCLAKGFPTAVTVVDTDGVVIVSERADRSTGATVNVSRQKAYAAAGFQSSTAELQELAKTQPGFVAIEGFSALPGGLPIKFGDEFVAGIGVSGAPTGEIDEECAVVGIKAVS